MQITQNCELCVEKRMLMRTCDFHAVDGCGCSNDGYVDVMYYHLSPVDYAVYAFEQYRNSTGNIDISDSGADQTIRNS